MWSPEKEFKKVVAISIVNWFAKIFESSGQKKI